MTTTVSYREAATTLWGEAGTYAHDAYDRIRAQLYPELPTQLPIVMGLTAYGHCIGLTRLEWEYGPRISVFSPLFAEGRLQVDDLLTHEMLHAWLMIQERNHNHDSDDWYAEIQRLSPLVLGRELTAKRGADRKSVRVANPAWGEGGDEPKTIVRKVRVQEAVQHQDVARWPQAFRPADYDWGDPIRCPMY
jgi:hypothetical protein